jgi:hypothetical protein
MLNWGLRIYPEFMDAMTPIGRGTYGDPVV